LSRGSKPAAPPAAIAGTWEVERVAVDGQDTLHQLYGSHDPRLLGRLFIVKEDQTKLKYENVLDCRQSVWPVRRTTWGFLLSRGFPRPSMGGRRARPTSSDFDIAVADEQRVSVFPLCPPPKRKNAKPFPQGYWAAPYRNGKLALRADSQFLLLLRRVLADEKPVAGNFDCSSPANPTEETICSDFDLASWDRSVALAQRELAEAHPGKVDEQRSAEEEYLRDRNACGTNAECIDEVQVARVEELVQRKGLP
jgi:hypothetical protein